jgi:hypothetical protein
MSTREVIPGSFGSKVREHLGLLDGVHPEVGVGAHHPVLAVFVRVPRRLRRMLGHGRHRSVARILLASLVGLGAAHGFKFAPTFGRLLAELAVSGTTTTDLSAFRLDRPALTDPSYAGHWLV